LTAVLEIILPVFAVILLGYGFGRGGFMSAEGARGIGAFVYYAAIPARMGTTSSTRSRPRIQ
jgi:predicted permease